MTFHPDEINQLIADIDHLLSYSGKGLSKFLSNQAPQEKEVLQRVRDFLVQLGEDKVPEAEMPVETTNPSPSQPFSSLLTQFTQQGDLQPVLQSSPSPPEPTNLEASQLKQEFNILLQPLQAELSKLLAERANLIQEIRQLEQKRLQNYSLNQQLANQEQMISEFLEVLMGRLVPHLKSNNSPIFNPTQQNLEAVTSAIQPILESAERVEQLANLARNLDQRLLSLDGTVNIVFEALERNINTYYQSLSQALAKMHSQGMQGEQLMANFLNNLTQYLQQQSLINEHDLVNVNTEIITASPLLTQSPPVEAVTHLEDVQTEIPPAEIESISLETDLSQNQPQLASELQLESTDEVDELYATFFNAESVSQLNLSFSSNSILPESEKVVNQELSTPENSHLTTSDLPEIAPSTTSAEPQEDVLLLPSLWGESPELETTSLPEETIPVTEVVIGEKSLEEPSSENTITVLTDLLVDTNHEQPALEVLSEKVNSEVRTSLPEQYVIAASEENLLALTDDDISGIPEIILDDKQRQQLDQDLANFDQPLTTLAEPTSQADAVTILTNEKVDTPQPQAKIEENVSSSVSTIQPSPITIEQPPVTVPQISVSKDENNDLIPRDTLNGTWYLGIDLGTTGISAALLNQSQLVVYPIYWSSENQTSNASFQQSFRLPAEVYLPTNSAAHQVKSGGSEFSQSSIPHHLYSAQLKPYLQIAVPYQQERQKWEPMLQLNEFSSGPLIWVVRSLSKLLLTLRSSQTSTTPALIANAVGMNIPTFSRVINNIAGVICSCPSSWTEQYRFNVREAILSSQLVSHPQQIFFVEEAIASLLPELDNANGQSIQISQNQGLQPLKTSDYPLVGNTLAINIGAIATEMTLVDIPANLGELTHKDFMLHNFAYSGKGIEQDIICQLLLPPKSRQPREPGQPNESANTNPWHWQPSIPGLDQMQFSSLGLEALTLPKVGEPDTQARIRLQQRLESSLLGQALLDAALALKLILQHQETFTLEFADQRWVLQRRDLESQVFVPFVRRLNRELNKLLVARGIPTEAINQAVLSGGVASVGTINRWLRQKLPNAKIIQDLYLGENGAPNCSRVALGLTMLPLHSQVLDIPKQQYTDYFLFSELLKLLPNRSLSFGEVLQLFESRGINTRICQQRLLAFLEGELPPGLIPAASDYLWLTHNSQENPDYKAIAPLTAGTVSSPLFEKQGNLSYRPNSQQVQLLLRYLDAIKSSTVQSLEEPYSYLLPSQPVSF
ncbi:hypothetical protein FJR38_18925 [Anabaena sp. UHCC 0253]|uniref:hypothetical protein n=1 Tax=Anabaena sp. UHCC 0253 TaxID=2590019 RepID=UPI00144653AB|nr:hypothetical protein [Anabaena sp. UHCC 0253]